MASCTRVLERFRDTVFLVLLMPFQQEFEARAMVTELEAKVTALTQTHTTQTALLEQANQQVQSSLQAFYRSPRVWNKSLHSKMTSLTTGLI